MVGYGVQRKESVVGAITQVKAEDLEKTGTSDITSALAGCIDSKAKKVDQSRCVDCYNCLSVCHKHSIKYGLGWKKGRKTPEKPVDTSKRQFVATVGALSLLLPNKVLAQGKAVVKANKSWQREHPLSPPGSQSAEHLLKHCTACHLCVTKCPSRVLKPRW